MFSVMIQKNVIATASELCLLLDSGTGSKVVHYRKGGHSVEESHMVAIMLLKMWQVPGVLTIKTQYPREGCSQR